MPIKHIILVGAGGHSKVVVDALLASGTQASNITIMDGNPDLAGQKNLGIEIVNFDKARFLNAAFHVCIGDNKTRELVTLQIKKLGGKHATIVHPDAYCSSTARISSGCFIAANVVLAPETVLEEGSIINHGAVVDHESMVGEYCHIAPNATLAGKTKIAAGTFVGAGANILPGVTVGKWCKVGAGAVVLKDTPDSTTLVGVPAKIV